MYIYIRWAQIWWRRPLGRSADVKIETGHTNTQQEQHNTRHDKNNTTNNHKKNHPPALNNENRIMDESFFGEWVPRYIDANIYMYMCIICIYIYTSGGRGSGVAATLGECADNRKNGGRELWVNTWGKALFLVQAVGLNQICFHFKALSGPFNPPCIAPRPPATTRMQCYCTTIA